MQKKLIVACMAVVAFAAFVLPATASATNKPTLRDSGGILPKGVKIVGTNSGDAIFWNTGVSVKQVTCTKAVLTGEVTKNAEDTVEGSISRFDFSGTGPNHPDTGLPECTDSFGGGAGITVTRKPLIIRSTPAMTTDEFQVTGTGGNIRFDILDTTVGTCEYEMTSALKGTFSTGGSQATLTVSNTQSGSGAKLIAGGFFCPSSGQLEMKFTLETEDGTPVWIESTP